jgi:hypothetical protein
MPFEKGNKYGGARPGAGRKPSAYTLLKQRKIAELGEEAEKSLDFYVQVRDNEAEPTAIRLEAARRIEERVFGKATQPIDANVTTHDWMSGKSAEEVAVIRRGAEIARTERERLRNVGEAGAARTIEPNA